MPQVSLVIAEYGANWAPWTRKLRADRESLMLLAQTADESPQVFGRRVVQRLRRLRRESVEIAEAAVVAGPESTPAHRGARTKMVRKVTSLLAQSGNDSHLFLDPAAETDGPAHTFMQALAWTLSDLAKGTGLSIRVGGTTSAASP